MKKTLFIRVAIRDDADIEITTANEIKIIAEKLNQKNHLAVRLTETSKAPQSLFSKTIAFLENHYTLLSSPSEASYTVNIDLHLKNE